MIARAQAFVRLSHLHSTQTEIAQTEEAKTSSAVDEEVEISFEEEIPRDSLRTPPPLPEYQYSGWLLSLPAFCIALMAWNVRWKSGGRRHARTRGKS